MRRVLARRVGTLTLSAAVSALLPSPTAHAAVRLHSATFNGTGSVTTEGPKFVKVTSFDTAINDDDCSAIVVVGVATPEVVRCSFRYDGTFVPDPDPRFACTGSAVSKGVFVVFLPSGAQTFEFTGMRAVVTGGAVHGIGTTYVDVGSGQTQTGYAEFDFGHGASACDRRVRNVGRVLY